FGSLQPIWTGLRLRTLDKELSQRLDISRDRGVLIEAVYPDSPSDRAGFRRWDVVTGIGGSAIAAKEDLMTALYSVPEGSRLAVEIWRDSEVVTLDLWAERPPEELGVKILQDRLGIIATERQGILYVSRVLSGSPAAAKGLRRGDLVLRAGGRPLSALEDLAHEVLRALDRGGVLLVVQRGRRAYYLSFRL
ncbi:MAG: PDZ domain-containing protein, partial [Acidobacteriota bacterium]|nr:PDZ domain-containing protein [Acidobacteriota bacterium]